MSKKTLPNPSYEPWTIKGQNISVDLEFLFIYEKYREARNRETDFYLLVVFP